MPLSIVRSSFVFLVFAALAGCNQNWGPRVTGSGVSATEERQVADFSGVKVEGSSNVTVTVGQSTSLTITADDNILPLIETTVRGDTLVISSRESYSSRLGVNVTLTTPSLSHVEITGSGNVKATGVDEAGFLVRITGSGDVHASGKAEKLSASIAGSGDLRLADLSVATATVKIAGSGNATVRAIDSLSIDIAGSGDVRYHGSPAQLNQTVAGSGRVTRVN